jgi:cytochrome P450
MAVTQAVEALMASDRLPFIGAAVMALVAVAVVPSLMGWGSNSLSAFPYFGEELGDESQRRAEFMKRAKSLYIEGYRKFTDTAFRLTTTRESRVVCVPAKFLPELHKYDDDTLSSSDATDELMQTKFTLLPTKEPTLVHMIKADLTPALRRLSPMIHAEITSAMRERFGECPDWTELNPNYLLLNVVAQVSGRIFVGEELCRHQPYLDTAINYTVNLMEAVRAITDVPAWKRSMTVASLPEVQKLRQHETDGFAMFVPIIQSRLKAREDSNNPQRDDLLQWSIDRLAEKGMIDPQTLARYQLTITFAAIHTTTLSTTNALYSLAAMPEIMPELRAEIREALAESNGVFTATALQNLKKLDSFCREDMRLHALGGSSFVRYVRKPIVLSNGQRIPAGVTIEVPSAGVNMDNSIFPDPDVFDPLRFYKLRADGLASGTDAATANARSQMVSISTDHLTFGFGRHACPGRFFAANVLKIILANILMNYDIQLIDSTERYPNLEFGGQNIPNPYKNLRFKRADL